MCVASEETFCPPLPSWGRQILFQGNRPSIRGLCRPPTILGHQGLGAGEASEGLNQTNGQRPWRLDAKCPRGLDGIGFFEAPHLKTGVDVNFIVPAGNEAEKLNAMIAGDALPDLITLGWWEGQIPMMIDADLIYSLDELADKYDPYFWKVTDPVKVGWYRQANGHIYGYPNASYTSTDYEKYKGKLTSNETFLVRKDMYEAIGSPDMTTPEGFLNALRAAKAQFPTVNGQALIPFGTNEFGDTGCSQLQGYLAHFLAIAPEKDGKFVNADLGLTDDPEYIRWMKMFRQAHEEGLFATDVFVDKRSQIEEKAAQGRYFCMLYQNWDMQAPQNALYARDPNSIYIAVDGPKNSKGDDPVLAGGGIAGWTVTLISKNCKDPARAIQFLSYLISEEGGASRRHLPDLSAQKVPEAALPLPL